MRACVVSNVRFGSPRSGSLLRLALLAALVLALSIVKLMLDGNAVSHNGIKSASEDVNHRSNSRKEMHGPTRRHVFIGNPVQKNRVRMFLEFNLTRKLKELGILSSSETCYAKFYWNGSDIITEEDAFQEICHGISEPMYQRLVLSYSTLFDIV